MPAVREYKTAAQINAEQTQRRRDEVRRQREVEQAYAAHQPPQVRFCNEMSALDKPIVDYPKGALRRLAEIERPYVGAAA